jgi:hypothetical protein
MINLQIESYLSKKNCVLVYLFKQAFLETIIPIYAL